jgi:hypothetical protein
VLCFAPREGACHDEWPKIGNNKIDRPALRARDPPMSIALANLPLLTN